jgi:hypothetical protein
MRAARRRAPCLAHAEAPLVGLGLAFLGVHYLAESIGVWWAYAAGLAITVGWSGVLWSVRRGAKIAVKKSDAA